VPPATLDDAPFSTEASEKVSSRCRFTPDSFDAWVESTERTELEREGKRQMRFLAYTLCNEEEAASAPPPSPELYQEMGNFVEEATKAGVVVATGGIAPTSAGAKISLKEDQFSVIDGPFAEAKELVGGWALMECRDLDEAVEWAKRFLGVLGEGEVRVRPVFGSE